ncbi:hypothetical protein OG352_23615 [Streptomyces sp. NBC_01485]|uniref:TetR/AcrR family transcriptional regulator n=1 Tax=Streptomyces sp. NBC_01485 TaxID=2903884 RepID=UPI002E30E23D|nr:hypothetical protein [Streptomyces sp. NBC_01485]
MNTYAPPGMGTVYRAVLDTMAEHGPHRPPIAQIARLADTNRQFLYRNWPDQRVLILKACTAELDRLLQRASNAGYELSPPCMLVAQIVRAARLVREHPVMVATARTNPDLLLSALTHPDTSLHLRALLWLQNRLYVRYPGMAEREPMSWTLLAMASPFALAPPPSHAPTDRTVLDARLSLYLHTCLNTSHDGPCPSTPRD